MRPSPIERHAVTRAFLEGGSKGFDSLLHSFGAALALTQGQKGKAEMSLCLCPIKRDALAGTFLEGGAVSDDGLFQALSSPAP